MRLFLLTGLCCAAFATTAANAQQNNPQTPVYGPSATTTAQTPANETATQRDNDRYRLYPMPETYQERVETGCKLRLKPIRLKVTCNLAPRN